MNFLKIKNIKIWFVIVLALFLFLNNVPSSSAQELNDESENLEEASDSEMESDGINITPQPINIGTLASPVIDKTNKPDRFDAKEFRKSTQDIPLGEGIRPARKIDFEERLRETNEKSASTPRKNPRLKEPLKSKKIKEHILNKE